MADEANIPTHRWYQQQNHIKLPMQDVSESVIKAAGIAKIDQFMITVASNALFAAGEVGVWYDPSDLTTLFQDVNAATPVTATGQSVAVMLDKSKGSSFGADIAVNGDFSQGATGWILGSGVTVSGGVAIIPAGGTAWLEQAVTTQAGRAYRVTATAVGVSGSFCGAWDNLSQQNNLPLLSGGSSGAGRFNTFSFTFIANDTVSYVSFVGGGNAAVTIDNVTIVPLPLGNHATQATAAQRPTYGIHPYSGVRNRLLYSEQFDNAYWTKSNGAITPDAAVAPNGTTTADRLSWVSTVNSQVQTPATTIPAGSTITLSTYAKAGTKSSLTLVMFTDGLNYVVVSFNLTSGTAGTPLVLGTRYTSVETTATSVGDGWYRCSVKTVTNTLTTVESWLRGDTLIGSGDNILLWGAQLEAGSSASAYQAVTTQYNITEAGVPSVYYIGFDGVDDSMATGAITPNTDKIQGFAGIKKLSDATLFSMVFEYGDLRFGSTGTATLNAPSSAAGRYGASSRGTLSVTADSPTSYLGVDTSVLTMQAEISTDLLTLRRNGGQVGQSSSDQGTGNFRNDILLIGRRGAGGSHLSGNIYSMIVRFGANLTDGQITNTETWVNQKTGAY